MVEEIEDPVEGEEVRTQGVTAGWKGASYKVSDVIWRQETLDVFRKTALLGGTKGIACFRRRPRYLCV